MSTLGSDIKYWLSIALLSINLISCGGGSGGTSEIIYTGKIIPAIVTTANGKSLAIDALQGGKTGVTVSANVSPIASTLSIDRPRIPALIQTLTSTLGRFQPTPMTGDLIHAAVFSVSKIVIPGTCTTNSGSATLTFSYDDTTGQMSGDISFNNYCDTGTTLSGNSSISGKYNANKKDFDTISITLTNLSATTASDSYTVTGDVTSDFTKTPQVITMDALIRDNKMNDVFKAENFILTLATDSANNDDITMSGRFYDPNEGYVDLSTAVPLHVNYGDDWPTSGQIKIMGQNNSSVLLKALSNSLYYEVDIDENGDGNIDSVMTARWFAPAGLYLATARYGHTATLLPNGKVLIVGGRNDIIGILPSAELYDPVINDFITTGNLITARANHTATLLPNGKVLVAGGENVSNGFITHLASAELYDPITGSFRRVGDLATARLSHTATLLPNGNVLIAGGFTGFSELYDPVTDSFTATGSLSNNHGLQTATLLSNGQVLIAGGGIPVFSNTSGLGTSAELYDPTTGNFIITGNITTPRIRHTATLLPNGRVLIAGGQNYGANAELYDPATSTFSITGAYVNPGGGLYGHTATLLSNGKVLIAGGFAGAALNTTELYDPTTGNFGTTKSLTSGRYSHTATLLQNGSVLIVGGQDSNGAALDAAELY